MIRGAQVVGGTEIATPETITDRLRSAVVELGRIAERITNFTERAGVNNKEASEPSNPQPPIPADTVSQTIEIGRLINYIGDKMSDVERIA